MKENPYKMIKLLFRLLCLKFWIEIMFSSKYSFLKLSALEKILFNRVSQLSGVTSSLLVSMIKNLFSFQEKNMEVTSE